MTVLGGAVRPTTVPALFTPAATDARTPQPAPPALALWKRKGNCGARRPVRRSSTPRRVAVAPVARARIDRQRRRPTGLDLGSALQAAFAPPLHPRQGSPLFPLARRVELKSRAASPTVTSAHRRAPPRPPVGGLFTARGRRPPGGGR